MPTLWLGKINRSYWDVPILSLAVDGAKAVTLRVTLGATLTGASFGDIISGASPLQVDESATAVSGGLNIVEITVGKTDTLLIPLEDLLPAKLWAGSVVTVQAQGANSTDVKVSVTLRSKI